MDEFDFRDQIQVTDWYPLEIHYKNAALFLVDHSLDLTEVANAVANDQTSVVEEWLKLELLKRPPLEQVERWRITPYEQIGEFIIVAPYVFLRLLHKH